MSLHSPSLGPSSPSPSSSAVTIPIPGRSILKKPPPAQGGLLSRMGLGSFLRSSSSAANNTSTQPGPSNVGEYGGKDVSSGKDGGGGKDGAKDESTRILKRAHFILPDGSRDKDAGGEESTGWPMDKVESFYRECCEGCQEVPDKGICAAFKTIPPTHPRTVSFSGVQLTPASAAILADVLSIEWGLRKVVWRECDLEEATLKPLLHALLIPRSLSFLSLASNKKLKGNAWRVVGAYVSKAHTLTFLDLSSNTLDKKAVECIGARWWSMCRWSSAQPPPRRSSSQYPTRCLVHERQ
ncbi:hypothetical protein B0H16DRAFT_505089 [Mycena metata]|uniref:Uncharacterized protein n=1 Tax=Mycena metata TaxID=1033252 RepID=A0AAD7NJA8_9AGAR|nr:hypothetical protein B0H16DRAFT_505089 [Mycena metata]